MSTSNVFVLLLRDVYRLSRADTNSKRYKKLYNKTVLLYWGQTLLYF